MSLFMLLTACWVQVEPVSFELVTFENDHTRAASAVVDTFEYDLACPDGQPARFYTVYDPDWIGPVATAIVLHSSVFDYVLSPSSGSPPEGNHYATGLGDYTRLHQAWGIAKVWETLGMYPTVDATEVNSGALPAVLVDKGLAGVYPINCWGDLWHNEGSVQPNDEAGDLFSRNGQALAIRVARLLSDEEFRTTKGVEFAFEPDLSRLILIGLGDATTGAVDLLRRDDMPRTIGVVFDAPVDDLSVWAGSSQFADRAKGLQRIFNYDPADVDPERRDEPDWSDFSIEGLALDGYLDEMRTAVLYSETDPYVPFPDQHYQGMLSALGDGDMVWTSDTGRSAHVFSNSDDDLARRAIEFLMTGNKPGGQ
jgi:hypothetical protein